MDLPIKNDHSFLYVYQRVTVVLWCHYGYGVKNKDLRRTTDFRIFLVCTIQLLGYLILIHSHLSIDNYGYTDNYR